MKRLAMAVLVLAVIFAASASAMAQQGQGRGGGGTRRAARLDTDGNGLISAAEWMGRKEAFNRLDANNDGYIDNTERQGARNQATRNARQQARQRTGQHARQAGQRGPQAGQRGRQAGQRGAMGQGARRRQMGPEGAGPQDRQGGRMQQTPASAGALFRLIDSDNDGRLSEAEVDAFARKVSAADADGDGYVTREEARETFRERVAERAGEAFFERNDANSDGVVTGDEFSGRPERFEQLDVNDDGVITSADFDERHERREGEGRGGRAQEGGRGQGTARGMREGSRPRRGGAW